MLRTRIAALVSNDIVRDVLRLMTGTVGGRAIVLVAMPFVTRLYSPQDFALLAVYLGVIAMMAVAACLRFDVAIPVAENDHDAAQLLVIALLSALAIAALSFIAILLAPELVTTVLGQPRLAPWLWLVPLGVLMSGSYSGLQFWATRTRRFGSIAITRISQAATGVSVMLALGWAGVAPLGLLLGNLLNTSAGGFRLGLETLCKDRSAFTVISRRSLASAFSTYRRFPLYSAPEALANLAGIQVPILIIAAYGGAEAGFLLLAQQVMAAPMSLLGSSVSQVYVSRAPEELREGRLASFTFSMLRRLMQIGVGPLIVAGFAGPLLFPLVFGSGWVRAGEIVAWMVPWTVLQFLASPISMVMYVVGKQGTMLILTVFGGVLRILPLLLCVYMERYHLVEVFSISSAIFYGICVIVFARSSRDGKMRG